MGQEEFLVIGNPRLDGRSVDAGLLASLPPAELARLEGRFAWARRDAGGVLYLGRDGSGLVPLYFDPSTAQAAARIEDLRADGQPRRLDGRESAWTSLRFAAWRSPLRSLRTKSVGAAHLPQDFRDALEIHGLVEKVLGAGVGARLRIRRCGAVVAARPGG